VDKIMTINKAHTDEQILQLIHKYWQSLPTVWHVVKAHIQKEATDNFDITVGQFHTLRRIHQGKDSVSKIASDSHISRPAISRLVDVLVNKGLVSRTPNPEDRRNLQLTLTGAGQDLLRDLMSNTHQWMAEKLRVLEGDERETVIEALEILNKAFE
jgi:DNA-binding MarR family transcriptional regulator